MQLLLMPLCKTPTSYGNMKLPKTKNKQQLFCNLELSNKASTNPMCIMSKKEISVLG